MYHNYMIFSAKKSFIVLMYKTITFCATVTSDYETNLGFVLMLTCLIDI